MARYQLVRGMRDILPAKASVWRAVEASLIDVLARYGYREIRLPIVEATELFAHGVGEATDLVEKEMYTFPDRKGHALSLRPEGTAGCVRACIESGLLRGPPLRLWYHGSMFRYERPQKGRTREHTQIGAETFGLAGPDVDAELLVMLARAFRELGVADDLVLELNTLGGAATRTRYRQALQRYLAPRADALDEASKRRLKTNPLRVLDSKVPATAALVADAPNIHEHLEDESRRHFDGLRRLLDAAAVPYRVNPRLVRGLDYYTNTVFEWTTSALGAQNAVASGGRYDGLVERLGGPATPGAGFAIGLDRLVLLHEARAGDAAAPVDVYVAATDAERAPGAAQVAERIRDATPLRVICHAGGGSLKSRLRAADRSGARWAVLVGEEEARRGGASLKPLRTGGACQAPQQALLDMDALLGELAKAAGSPGDRGAPPPAA